MRMRLKISRVTQMLTDLVINDAHDAHAAIVAEKSLTAGQVGTCFPRVTR